jgi:hypothetical protein
MMSLSDLAERCERATRSGAALDAAIWCALNGVALSDKLVADFERGQAPRYTASLDAALTLVPEGFDWIIGRTNSGLTIHAEVGGRGGEYQRFAETPALALCAAALRARDVSRHSSEGRRFNGD